jgi:uncharacterized membrane protein YdbT with pleckstrin-like domain
MLFFYEFTLGSEVWAWRRGITSLFVCVYILGGIIIVTILPITWIVTGLALLDV